MTALGKLKNNLGNKSGKLFEDISFLTLFNVLRNMIIKTKPVTELILKITHSQQLI